MTDSLYQRRSVINQPLFPPHRIYSRRDNDIPWDSLASFETLLPRPRKIAQIVIVLSCNKRVWRVSGSTAKNTSWDVRFSFFASLHTRSFMTYFAADINIVSSSEGNVWTCFCSAAFRLFYFSQLSEMYNEVAIFSSRATIPIKQEIVKTAQRHACIH